MQLSSDEVHVEDFVQEIQAIPNHPQTKWLILQLPQ